MTRWWQGNEATGTLILCVTATLEMMQPLYKKF